MSSGYILTNNHVVEGADEIEVVPTTPARSAQRSAPIPTPTWPSSRLSLDKRS
jgi:S1-C subfamily serine protease